MKLNKKFWRGKKVLITGHTGFKGGWLSVILNLLGSEVSGFALNPQGKYNFFNTTKIKKFFKYDFRHDITDIKYLKKSIKNSPYKVIVTGDLNNTAFSYVYKELSKSLNDAFKAKGNGLGITYNYNFIPLRIDFVFTEELFKINSFKTFKLNLSDHEPIFTELKF